MILYLQRKYSKRIQIDFTTGEIKKNSIFHSNSHMKQKTLNQNWNTIKYENYWTKCHAKPTIKLTKKCNNCLFLTFRYQKVLANNDYILM
jgi:hypothetical protein